MLDGIEVEVRDVDVTNVVDDVSSSTSVEDLFDVGHDVGIGVLFVNERDEVSREA